MEMDGKIGNRTFFDTPIQERKKRDETQDQNDWFGPGWNVIQ